MELKGRAEGDKMKYNLILQGTETKDGMPTAAMALTKATLNEAKTTEEKIQMLGRAVLALLRRIDDLEMSSK